jgi:RNA methyltransferase, TrmH family
VITSIRNPKVAAALKLHKRTFRERERVFLVEGVQALGEALSSPDASISTLFHAQPGHALVDRAAAAGIATVHVSEDIMVRLTGTVTPQGFVGVASYVDVPLAEVPGDATCVALLHEVRDPGNAGTVLRSADAVGADAVVFSSSSVDVYNAKTVRASAGSLFHLPVVRGPETATAIDVLRARGMRVLAMDAGGEGDLYEQDLSDPVVFLFGNEAWGLPEEVASLADATVRVPITGRAESLNLAAAATVCLFEWGRQRREGRRAVLETIIAAAAHDIRSPLTAMKGIGHALATRWEQMSPEDRDLMLRGIQFDTDRLNAILRQLVDAARVAAGALDLYPQRTSVPRIVDEIATSLARDPDHVRVEWAGGEELTVFLDPERLRLVLEAFVESLVWWASEGPVRVDGRLQQGRLRVQAYRAETGLTQEDAERLFRPRAPGTGSGSKIGLYVAQGVAEAQGGSVSAHVSGRALSFELDLPVPPEPDA